MGRNYDPWSHAFELRLDITEETLPAGVHGAYQHDKRLVILRPGLSQRSARCTLAHEIQHHLAGDTVTCSIFLHRKAELLASKRAAWMLVDPFEYVEAEALHEGHLASMAHSLDVTVRVLRDWQSLVYAVAA